jgi:hypothetical protein
MATRVVPRSSIAEAIVKTLLRCRFRLDELRAVVARATALRRSAADCGNTAARWRAFTLEGAATRSAHRSAHQRRVKA